MRCRFSDLGMCMVYLMVATTITDTDNTGEDLFGVVPVESSQVIDEVSKSVENISKEKSNSILMVYTRGMVSHSIDVKAMIMDTINLESLPVRGCGNHKG